MRSYRQDEGPANAVVRQTADDPLILTTSGPQESLKLRVGADEVGAAIAIHDLAHPPSRNEAAERVSGIVANGLQVDGSRAETDKYGQKGFVGLLTASLGRPKPDGAVEVHSHVLKRSAGNDPSSRE